MTVYWTMQMDQCVRGRWKMQATVLMIMHGAPPPDARVYDI